MAQERRIKWLADSIEEQIKEVVEKILKAEPRKAYVFFNNDHVML